MRFSTYTDVKAFLLDYFFKTVSVSLSRSSFFLSSWIEAKNSYVMKILTFLTKKPLFIVNVLWKLQKCDMIEFNVCFGKKL